MDSKAHVQNSGCGTSSTTSADTAPALSSRHPDLYLEDEPGAIVFLVEQTFFRIHPYFLKKHSLIFADMFSLHSGGKPEEGRSDDLPIVLDGVKAIDFERLLSLFYQRDVLHGDLKTLDDWTSVLALTTKWEFEAHRALAIERLSRIGSPTDRIVLARAYDIPDWLEEAFYCLCARDESLTLEEGIRLGMADVIMLADLRQRIRVQAWGYTWHEATVKHTIRVSLTATSRR